MKKRLGILALAATLIVQSAAFVPTFAENTAAEPTAAEETVLARYASADYLDIENTDNLPWQPFVSVWGQTWTLAGDGKTVGDEDGTNFKSTLKKGVWWDTGAGKAGDLLAIHREGGSESQGSAGCISTTIMGAGEGGANRVRVAKVFTAPMTGIVKIGSDNDTSTEENDNLIVGVAEKDGAAVSIESSSAGVILDKKQLSTENDDADIIKYANDNGKVTKLGYEYSTYKTITKGEKLYFIVGNVDTNYTNGWHSFINWNPIVEYLAYQPEYSEITYDRNGASFKVTNDPGITEENIYVLYYDENNDEHKVEIINFENKDGYITFDFADKLQGGISYDIVIDKSISVAGIYMTVGNNYEGLTVDAANNTFSSYRKETSWDNDSIWAAYWRTWDDQMQLMTSGINGNDANGDHNYDDAVPALGIHGNNTWLGHMKTADKTAWDNNVYVPFVGPTLMSAGGGYPWDAGYYAGYTVAKGFTAPYSGNVRIEQNNIVAKTTNDNGESVVDTTKKNEIWSNASGDNSGVNLRITKNKINTSSDRSSVIWGDAQLNGANNGTYVFEPITVYVNKGDILYFAIEPVNRNWSTNDETLVHWNPVVTYTDVAINAAFIDSSGNALTTVANLLAADGAQLKMSAFDAAEDVAGTPIIVFCDENGALVKTVIGNTVNLEAVLGNTTVQLGDLTGVNAKSVKVMLWSADGTLKPLTGVFGELN